MPAGVINVNHDNDDEEAYGGEQKEINKEMDELRAAQHWVNQPGWDMASEGRAFSPNTNAERDLRLDWSDVKKKLAQGSEADAASAGAKLNRADVERDYALDDLDPTQRAFADRALLWARELTEAYKEVHATGKQCRLPQLRTWLGGSAGAGKSRTLKTIVQHVRLYFQEQGVGATIEITA